MSTTLGLVSDVHASPKLLASALELFQQEKVDRILCTGDIAGYGDELEATVALLVESGCESICGNHDRWHLEGPAGMSPSRVRNYLSGLPVTLERTIEGRRLYAVHASPPDSLMEGIRLLDEYGVIVEDERERWSTRLESFAHDLLVVGHTHQLFAERLGGTLVVNPGSTLFNRSCAIIELPSLETRLLPLPGMTSRQVWSWSGGWK